MRRRKCAESVFVPARVTAVYRERYEIVSETELALPG
jgi:hypothetical protein